MRKILSIVDGEYRGLAADVKGGAQQPVGFEAGLRGAWLRIEAIRAVYPEAPVVAVENFLYEMAPEKYVFLI